MMRFSNGGRADDPLGRFRAGWAARARKARDTWTPGTGPVEEAIEEGSREGVKFAAETLEKEGHLESANVVRMRALSGRSEDPRFGWEDFELQAVAVRPRVAETFPPV